MADRHQFRANWHDYNAGIYFITICTHGKRHLFGDIKDGQFNPTKIGTIVKNNIEAIPLHHNCEVWNYVVMPNHIHMVLSVGTRYIASDPNIPRPDIASDPDIPKYGCLKPGRNGTPMQDYHHNSQLAVIIGTLKASVTRTVRTLYPKSIFTRTRYTKSISSRTRCTKSISTRTRCIASLHDQPIWQSRYHEHIIRNQRSFDNIMLYIDTNVENWGKDCFNNTKM